MKQETINELKDWLLEKMKYSDRDIRFSPALYLGYYDSLNHLKELESRDCCLSLTEAGY